MAAVDEVHEALERVVPSFADRTGDWASVLGQARERERVPRTRTV